MTDRRTACSDDPLGDGRNHVPAPIRLLRFAVVVAAIETAPGELGDVEQKVERSLEDDAVVRNAEQRLEQEALVLLPAVLRGNQQLRQAFRRRPAAIEQGGDFERQQRSDVQILGRSTGAAGLTIMSW